MIPITGEEFRIVLNTSRPSRREAPSLEIEAVVVANWSAMKSVRWQVQMPNEQKINTMTVDELETVLDWAADEGWNPGQADAEAFHAADPQGFFMTRIDGSPVAAISVINHDAENAFLGLYISRPEWRGKGVGLQTWKHALGHAGPRSVGLDGVPAQEQNYRMSGFVRTGSSLRFVGRWPSCSNAAIRPVAADNTSSLIALDARANGFARPRFLTAWLSHVPLRRDSRVLAKEGEIHGFATWRACREGTKIGPVIAPDTASAIDLIADIAAVRPEGPLIIDVPEANRSLRRELESAGFEVPFVTARMYRGAIPKQHVSLQAIATMELG